jgi:hypothetical protein
MTFQQLRHWHQAQPFTPFIVHLADGAKIPVPHRELLSHSPSGRTIVIHGEGESMSVVDLLLVTRLEIDPARAKNQNGSTSH